MYPEVRKLLPELEDDVLESYEEHHVADLLCTELSGMPADAEHFDAKTTVLIENVTRLLEEEEQDWFPKVRAGLGRKRLQELGAKLEQARSKAPRTPAHPSALKKTIDALISGRTRLDMQPPTATRTGSPRKGLPTATPATASRPRATAPGRPSDPCNRRARGRSPYPSSAWFRVVPGGSLACSRRLSRRPSRLPNLCHV